MKNWRHGCQKRVELRNQSNYFLFTITPLTSALWRQIRGILSHTRRQLRTPTRGVGQRIESRRGASARSGVRAGGGRGARLVEAAVAEDVHVARAV